MISIVSLFIFIILLFFLSIFLHTVSHVVFLKDMGYILSRLLSVRIRRLRPDRLSADTKVVLLWAIL